MMINMGKGVIRSRIIDDGIVHRVRVHRLKAWTEKWADRIVPSKYAGQKGDVVLAKIALKAAMEIPIEYIKEAQSIKETMLQKFEHWAGTKPQIQRKLVEALEDNDIRSEGNGDWQLSNTQTPKLEAGCIKLRYNVNTGRMIIYLRGWQAKL